MTGSEIRQRFLKYFERKGHTIVGSSSLIPQHDPTLLFTNAGMVQFKGLFSGEEKREYTRATSSQRCMRAGGKHNDLENVGITARHHTFFEMLGNFSFGDYFKEKAIEMGWEFLIKELDLPEDKMWITVFKDDDEAFDIWRDKIGLSEERIVRMGEEDNFWAMGETGPCGPCSEILIDQGKEVGCGKPECNVGCDCDRFLELWNLVFTQFDRDKDGVLNPLPKPSIDTGMGLERITAVVQGVRSNYDTDLFMAIIKYIDDISESVYGSNEKDDVSTRVIADHSRAVTFLIGDGVLPSNEGRGYVLRRIMRRGARHGKILGIDKPFLYRVSGVVVDTMKEAYPELANARNYIAEVVYNEEERFSQTLKNGLTILYEEMERLQETEKMQIPGRLLFKLYDTYGFPVDLAHDIVKDEGFTIDKRGFQDAMDEQRHRARESWRGSGEEKILDVYKELARDKIKSSFVGYDNGDSLMSGIVLAIIKDDKEANLAGEGGSIEVVTGNTPFYSESGGQVGDTGSIVNDLLYMEVEDTLRPLPNLIVHRGKIKSGSLKKGDKVSFHLDKDRRQRIACNHTATHLLHAVLKEVFGDHVKQSGSYVASEKLRFDFTHFSQITRMELCRVEELVNERIRGNTEVDTSIVPFKEALESGAIALFGEKYGNEVRVVRIGGYSKELCGGTHVKRTGDIGLFKITSESSIAAGVRRVEALTGWEALRYVKNEEDDLREVGSILKAKRDEIIGKADKLLQQNKSLEKEIAFYKGILASNESESLLSRVKEIGGVKVLSAKVDINSSKTLRDFADRLKDRLKSGIILLAGQKDSNVLLITVVTKDLTHRFNASKIIKEVSNVVGGSGGGRPDMAQAGGNRLEYLNKALESIYDIVRNAAST